MLTADAALDDDEVLADTAETKRPRGRPKGLTKTGGRKRGTPNRTRAATVARIETEADPLGFLIQVAKGNRIPAALEVGDKSRTWVVPTLDQRLDANRQLLRKILPDVKAVELSGDGLLGAVEVVSTLSLRGRDSSLRAKPNGHAAPSPAPDDGAASMGETE